MSELHTVNKLPVATWNHLGVNGASIPAFPPLHERKGFDLQCAMPFTVEFKDVKIESRGDAPLEEYIYQNKNAQLSVSISKEVTDPLHIKANISKESPLLVESVNISVEEDSSAKVFHLVSSDKDSNGHYAGLVKVKAEKNAQLHLVLIQLFDNSMKSWTQVVIEEAEGASVEVVRVLLGSTNTLSAVKSNLLGDNSTFALNTYYHAKDENILDINDIALHMGKNTSSDMYMGGILDDKATKIYRGTIDFKKGAVKAVGKEIDDVLLMSPNVHNRTCPLILCGEESVAGEHAATIGRFNDEQLFYLCSRGLSVEQAKQLLVDAKLHNVVSKIQDEELQKIVLDFAR